MVIRKRNLVFALLFGFNDMSVAPRRIESDELAGMIFGESSAGLASCHPRESTLEKGDSNEQRASYFLCRKMVTQTLVFSGSFILVYSSIKSK
jgi:hypothetical protein